MNSRTIIRVKCDDQTLKVTEAPIVASGGLNETVIAFDFCEKWNGFSKTGVFYRDEEELFHAVVDENDTCVVPWEVCAEPGYFYFSVFGDKGDIRRTSNTLRYKATKGINAKSMIPSDPSPKVYDQIMADVAAIRESKENFLEEVEAVVATSLTVANDATARANASAEKAERVAQELTEARNSGEFKGDKGETGEKGEKGDTGAQGIQGIQGIQGEKGDKGDPGEKGDTGDKGDPGETCDLGDFVESTEYPGCYYREVTKTVRDQEGNYGTIVEQEWLNPPMVSSNVYRTTKRHSIRFPVYVTRINLGKLPNSSSKMVDQQTATQHPDGCVDYAMFNLNVNTILKVAPQIYYGESVYTHVDGAEIKASHYGGLYVECYADTTKDLSSYACYVYVEFTATWDY